MSDNEKLIEEGMETLRSMAKSAASSVAPSAERLKAVAESIDWSVVRTLELDWKTVEGELVPVLKIETYPNGEEVGS